MQDYQKQRVLTLLNPDSDPLGAGYNIIQSKIAIGSGGLFGKGWTNGSQAQLEFLPERDTDFIFAVMGEELGLLGVLSLLGLYLIVVGRGLLIATQARDTFSRLLAGSISLTFFVYVFVNTAMVTGLVPVVGVPLPLVSFGGTSMVTLMAGFGILHVHTQPPETFVSPMKFIMESRLLPLMVLLFTSPAASALVTSRGGCQSLYRLYGQRTRLRSGNTRGGTAECRVSGIDHQG